MIRRLAIASAVLLLCAGATTSRPTYDIVIRKGMIYDGSGSDAVRGDVAISGDRIAAVGKVGGAGKTEIDAHGLTIAPGFINVMSQAQESLIADGRGMSDVKQGVTTEIFGEGESMGPLSPAMQAQLNTYQTDTKY